MGAVFVRFLQKEFDVVRVKNRFSQDTVEKVTVERLQAEFYSADVCQEDMESNASSGSGLHRYERNYRDVMLNLVLKGDSGTPFVCEVQVTLSGISILEVRAGDVHSDAHGAPAGARENVRLFVSQHGRHGRGHPNEERDEERCPAVAVDGRNFRRSREGG